MCRSCVCGSVLWCYVRNLKRERSSQRESVSRHRTEGPLEELHGEVERNGGEDRSSRRDMRNFSPSLMRAKIEIKTSEKRMWRGKTEAVWGEKKTTKKLWCVCVGGKNCCCFLRMTGGGEGGDRVGSAGAIVINLYSKYKKREKFFFVSCTYIVSFQIFF